ncbi:MAG TPA: helix-turn-helix domain-containing protein [Myxococcota bacterium]|nr:helix-turn-helix domain-containing protein [Myxococcota bacterium]
MKFTSVTRQARDGRRPRRAPRRAPALTRPRLVAAATELFAEHGLHAVTSAQIARRAGLATGTFYLYFADKLELFRAIVFEALAELRGRQDAAAARHAAGSREELAARTEEFLDFAEEKRALMRVLFARSAEAAGIADEIAGVIAPAIERRYQALQAAGGMARDIHAAVAAQMRAAALVRIAAWWTEDPSRATRADVARTLQRLDPGASAHAPNP